MSAYRERNEKLIYINKSGFVLCQQNGQRTYGGPPPNWGSRPPPSRECEVFIGRLPRICFEDELIPLFLSAGELYEFRLMLDFSGTNRGYGYAHYATPEGAQRAIEKLNKYEIRPGHPIGVLKSKNNCRLLFGNINTALNRGSFNEFIRTTTDQVLNVIMFKKFQQLKQTDFRISPEVEEAFLGRMPRNNGNNQFAIVEYENHKAAAVARRVLIPKYGHILAIDWAVPPRERKRFVTGIDAQVPAIERPFSKTATNDSNLHVVSKSNSKVRPVPVLLVQLSPLDNVDFMPKSFKTVVKFFKYQLSICLYKSVDVMEIPLFICKEIERKIVDRITNLENCTQAVQLIFNYFSWYNEKKRFTMSSEVQKLLQEIKFYAESFVLFVYRKLKYDQSESSEENNYYIHILPLQLNVLFRIILRSDPEYLASSSVGISKGLKWLTDVMQSENKPLREFVQGIIDLVKNEDETSLDRESTLAKSLFLNKITSHQHKYFGNPSFIDFTFQKNVPNKTKTETELTVKVVDGMNENQRFVSSNSVNALQKVTSNLNYQDLEGSTEQCIPMPLPRIDHFDGETENSLPPVPLLSVLPSIMNRIPFMPAIFYGVLKYFKYLIRNGVGVSAWQINIPQQILKEIEKKIISRISNMENCSRGIQLILDYFSMWVKKNFDENQLISVEGEKLLKEVKIYADSFINFVWSKTMSVHISNEAEEDYFCRILPLRLNLLFQMTLIFNQENPTKLIGITEGLNWMQDWIQKSEKTKKFLEELTRYIIDSDQNAYERAQNFGKVFFAEMINSNGEADNIQILPRSSTLETGTEMSQSPSSHLSLNSEISSDLSGSGSASDAIFDYGP